MADLTQSPTPLPPRQAPFREDCWTEEATSTLVDAWGQRYLELNRGNLRQKDWQEVADIVNATHGHTKKTYRTDVQCKNRIDTLKKKYKTERARIAQSNGTLTSPWLFFRRLEFLIGSNISKHCHGKVITSAVPIASSPPQPAPPLAVPLSYRRPLTPAVATPVSLPQKRPMLDSSFLRNNYWAMAAAAAAAEDEDDELEGDEEEGSEDGGGEEEENGMRRLAEAIEKFGEVFEKVESMKQRQMVELEKQRMQFAKDVEVQRLQLFMDTWVQLQKKKRPKPSGSSHG